MKEARLFEKDTSRVVTALDVKDGRVDKESQFIDIEEEFRVNFVSDSKGHCGPYFRLYMAREDYKKLSPEQKDRYDIVRDMRRYKESPWHLYWKECLSSFCLIEKSIRNEESLKYKIADAFYKNKNTVIELQHSYIAHDFEERNAHYDALGINVVWLYDLPKARLRKTDDGSFEILEDNARGFFRIAEKPDNLVNYPVFIQVSGGNIYLVKELRRKEIDGVLKSTVRLFDPVKEFDEISFLESLQKLDDCFLSEPYKKKVKGEPHSIYELWEAGYKRMVVFDTINKEYIAVYADGKNKNRMSRNYQFDHIGYRYMEMGSRGGFYPKNETYYDLSEERAHSKTWILKDVVKF